MARRSNDFTCRERILLPCTSDQKILSMYESMKAGSDESSVNL